MRLLLFSVLLLFICTAFDATPAAAQRIVIGCDICPEVVIIPGGTFVMGTPDGDDDERPVHEVQVESFGIGVFEVTHLEFDTYAADTGHSHPVQHCPRQRDRGLSAGCVSWEQAQQYIEWLNERRAATSFQYRLPSEAEWEYVAGRAAELGVFGMIGGVWEWTGDCWHSNYLGAPPDGSAWLQLGDCDRRIVRGGSWVEDARGRRRFRAQDREQARTGRIAVDTGFRVAVSLPREDD